MRRFLVFVLLLPGCLSLASFTSMQVRETPEDMRREVLRFVPIGMEVERATDILERQGFRKQYTLASTSDWLTYSKSFPKERSEDLVTITLYVRAGLIREIEAKTVNQPCPTRKS